MERLLGPGRDRSIGAGTGQGIAERFRVSEDTVKHHLSSVFDKVGVSSRLELAVFAFTHGLVMLQDGLVMIRDGGIIPPV